MSSNEIIIKCGRCNVFLNEEKFFYNGKTHKCCFSCNNKRSNRKNICKTCDIRASFNFEGNTNGIYCKKHSEPGMINVVSPRCNAEDCSKQPNFNFEGESRALYCSKCAEPGMIDIKNPRCKAEGCKTRASYGIPCNLPSRCAVHKQEGMIIRPRGKCRIKDCKEIATHGTHKPIHCENHKTDNDVDLVERKCTQCGSIDIIINGLYK